MLAGKANYETKLLTAHYNNKAATSEPKVHGAFYNTGFASDI